MNVTPDAGVLECGDGEPGTLVVVHSPVQMCSRCDQFLGIKGSMGYQYSLRRSCGGTLATEVGTHFTVENLKLELGYNYFCEL